MNKSSLIEKSSHGTPAFPVAIYNMNFEKEISLLAPLHYHNEFELIVATKGTIDIKLEEDTFTLKEGEGLFINSEMLHLISTSHNLEAGFIAIVFDYSIICSNKDLIYTKYIKPLSEGLIKPDCILNKDMCEKILDIYSIFSASSFGYEIFIRQVLCEIIYTILKKSTPLEDSAQNNKSVLIKSVLDFIEEHYTEQISLTDMAIHAHISKEYLCRLFSSIYNTTPVEYLNRYRIRQSTDALIYSNRTISDIAMSCGFNNSSYYNKMFLRYIGCTPSEFKKKFTTYY